MTSEERREQKRREMQADIQGFMSPPTFRRQTLANESALLNRFKSHPGEAPAVLPTSLTETSDVPRSAPIPRPVADLPSPAPARALADTEPRPVQPADSAIRDEVSARETSNLTIETLLDKLAEQVENFKRPPNAKRIPIAVSKDVFSRVTYLAKLRNLDKIEVLTYLLVKHMPTDPKASLPRWLGSERRGPQRTDYLSYLENEQLALGFSWLQLRAGLNKVDVIEKLILQYLPQSPFDIPAKQRRKIQRGTR